MGNIQSSNNIYTQRFPLDNSSLVVVRKTKSHEGRDFVDNWSADYNSFGRTTCELDLTKTNHEEEDELSISIHDHASSHASDDVDFQMNMRIEEALLSANVTLNGPRSMQRLPERKTATSQGGGVLKSSSFLYGSDTDRKGLIVILREKRSDDDVELPYMITVKHYFVAACCSRGVAVVAKIRSDSGGLSVEVEKPFMQPKRELLSMFDDVKGKGWLPNTTTGSDYAIEVSNNRNNVSQVPMISISGQQSISSLLSTSGYTNGNYNGSLIFHGCHVLFDAAFAPLRKWSN